MSRKADRRENTRLISQSCIYPTTNWDYERASDSVKDAGQGVETHGYAHQERRMLWVALDSAEGLETHKPCNTTDSGLCLQRWESWFHQLQDEQKWKSFQCEYYHAGYEPEVFKTGAATSNWICILSCLCLCHLKHIMAGRGKTACTNMYQNPCRRKREGKYTLWFDLKYSSNRKLMGLISWSETYPRAGGADGDTPAHSLNIQNKLCRQNHWAKYFNQSCNCLRDFFGERPKSWQ